MMRRVLKWIGVLLASAVALAVVAYMYYWYIPAPEVPKLSSAIHRATLRVGDRDRTYAAYAPAQLRRGAPLVIVLHGSTMDGAQMRAWTGYEFEQEADRRGFVVVYPDGYQHNWNDCRRDVSFPARLENIDDMAFMRALIARMKTEHGIDSRRVFVLGFSNGGHLAFRLAIEARDEVAGIVAIAANLPSAGTSLCAEQGRTARVMLVAGTEDPINPYEGGVLSLFGFNKRGTVISARASAEEFARRNGVAAEPTTVHMPRRDERDPTSVERLTWGDGQMPATLLYTVHGGGHVVPQPVVRYPRLLGRVTGDLDAPLAALEFFGL